MKSPHRAVIDQTALQIESPTASMVLVQATTDLGDASAAEPNGADEGDDDDDENVRLVNASAAADTHSSSLDGGASAEDATSEQRLLVNGTGSNAIATEAVGTNGAGSNGTADAADDTSELQLWKPDR